MSGRAHGPGATLARGVLLTAELPMRGVVGVRDWLHRSRLREARRLPRPVVCVGNLTTGGTGKTPVVIWLARQLLRQGRRPAILLRGYRAGAGGSDEAALLDDALNAGAAGAAGVTVHTGADRFASGTAALRVHPEIDAFVLDDGFQHRRLARDLDVVLIDATNPFGYGHLLPRGLLREPLTALRRASVMVITRADQAHTTSLDETIRVIRQHNPNVPIFRARHALQTLLDPRNTPRPIDDLRGRRVFVFCGIGNPQGFHEQLLAHGAMDAGTRWFGDHHAYTPQDVTELRASAVAAGAEMLVTTEKDWVKLRRLDTAANDASPPIVRAAMDIAFEDNAGGDLMQLVVGRLWPARQS
jgi:tetraacyldisaccharide 4'-kinase